MTDPWRAAVNKRLTLNLLIQGAASHTFLTSHHLVRGELGAIDPALVGLYDRLGVSVYLNAWKGDLTLVLGRPRVFWGRTERPNHPFHNHRLLREHGAELAEASKQHALARAREKGVPTGTLLFYPRMLRTTFAVIKAERPHREALADVAVEAAARVWGVDRSRLHAAITLDMSGFVPPPGGGRTARIIRFAVAGYSQVVREDDRLAVHARAVSWVLLSHELVKGIAELVCLHGLASMGDEEYASVIAASDKLEEESWLMQAGAELWRRLLAVAPKDRPLAETLMHVSRLDAADLDDLMLRVTRRDASAERDLRAIGD